MDILTDSQVEKQPEVIQQSEIILINTTITSLANLDNFRCQSNSVSPIRFESLKANLFSNFIIKPILGILPVTADN